MIRFAVPDVADKSVYRSYTYSCLSGFNEYLLKTTPLAEFKNTAQITPPFKITHLKIDKYSSTCQTPLNLSVNRNFPRITASPVSF
jgi:hypothetical protein